MQRSQQLGSNFLMAEERVMARLMEMRRKKGVSKEELLAARDALWPFHIPGKA